MEVNLNLNNIPLISSNIKVPEYEINEVNPGIVHIGVGGFHRAHQAYFAQKLLNKGLGKQWGICGVALLKSDKKIFETLTAQNNLYTLMIPDRGGTYSAEVIGSIVEFLYAPENPKEVIHKIASVSTKIISMTITEGGYNFDSEGNFDWNNDLVLWDLEHPESPKTVFGFLCNSIKLRKEQGSNGVTIQSCDNIEHNGDILRKMVYAFISKADPTLIDWLGKNVTFPNSMVDRITPRTNPELKHELKKHFGIIDNWPVVSEQFIQWIIEDNFISGRPEWEKVGGQMVSDVTPYEKMKIRLLNGGHTLVGLAGYLKGYKYIHESVDDPEIRSLLKRYLDEEVTPTLNPVPGVDLQEYKNEIIERFGNPFIKDEVGRIISGSSAKIPKFILPTVFDQLSAGRTINIGALIVSCWYQYLKLNIERPEQVQDEMRENLLGTVAHAEERSNHLLFLTEPSLFGALSNYESFTDKFLTYINAGESLFNAAKLA